MHVLIFPTKPFVEWGLQGESQICSPAVTLTFDQESMCGMINGLCSNSVIALSIIIKHCFFDRHVQLHRHEQLVGVILGSSYRFSERFLAKRSVGVLTGKIIVLVNAKLHAFSLYN